jgi:hypothetical protein
MIMPSLKITNQKGNEAYKKFFVALEDMKISFCSRKSSMPL